MKIIAATLAAALFCGAAFARPSAADAPPLDSRKFLVCQSWGLSALVLLLAADRNKTSVDAVAATLYKVPDPYLMSLAHLAADMKRDELVSLRDEHSRWQLVGALTGVCYTTLPAPRQAAPIT